MFDVDDDETGLMLRGVASALRADGSLSPTQTAMLSAVSTYLLERPTDVDQLAAIGPDELAQALPNPVLRQRAVQAMVTLELVDNPIRPEVAASVQRYATALQVDEAMLAVAHDYSDGALAAARDDYLRNSYVFGFYSSHDNDGSLHRTVRQPGDPEPDSRLDPALAARWSALENCPAGSHGRMVWDFYQMRGFSIPGTPEAVDPLLAQHDWVHTLADYGTSALGEVEVFSFIAGAIPDPRGFSYLVAIFGLFQTGFLPEVPGVATADPGHLDEPGAPTRFADAVRRGLAVHRDVMGGTDWFATANLPVDQVRAQFGLPPKSEAAVTAGSLGAMDPRAVFTHDH